MYNRHYFKNTQTVFCVFVHIGAVFKINKYRFGSVYVCMLEEGGNKHVSHAGYLIQQMYEYIHLGI